MSLLDRSSNAADMTVAKIESEKSMRGAGMNPRNPK